MINEQLVDLSRLQFAAAGGFVRGVGFVPRHWLTRWLLSASACFVALGLAVAMLANG